MLGWKSARPSAEREVAGSNTGKTRVLQKLTSSLLKNGIPQETPATLPIKKVET